MEARTSNQSDRLTHVLGPERHDYMREMGLGPTRADIWGSSIDDDMEATRENRELHEILVNLQTQLAEVQRILGTSFKQSKCYSLRKDVLLFHVLILDKSL